MVDQKVVNCGAACCAVVFLVSAIMVGCSFDTLDPLNAGLRLNKASNSIDTKHIYTAGRYHVGLGKSFVKYPITYQNIEYSSNAGSDDSALSVNSPRITIECSFQFQLQRELLQQVYRNYEKTYKSVFVRIGKDVIQSATDATLFSTEDFYKRREVIQASILSDLQARFALEGASVVDFQLRSVELQAITQQTITQTIISDQKSATEALNGTIRLIDADTEVIQGEADRNIRVFEAEKQRDADVIVDSATASATRIRIAAENEAFLALKETLGFSNSELLRYIWLRSVRSAANATFAMGYSSPIITPA